MPRLIDADELFINLDGMMEVSPTGYIHGETVADMISDAPTIDAVPVVRCKDCVHWEKNNWNPNGMCNAFDDGSVCILTETDVDEYCARAERKEE